jgi:hypothetical protein
MSLTENPQFFSPCCSIQIMKFTLGVCVALALCAPQGSAQTAVLIGLHLKAGDDENGTTHPPSYRTFLITFRDGKAQLAADVPDLIVPRKDGFWRLGSLHKGPACCGGYQEFVYAVPTKSVPHAIGEFHPPNPDWNCSETDEATIEFVNPNLLSVSYFTHPACSLEVEYRHRTYKIDELEKELDITAVLGPPAWDAEKKADAKAKSDHAFSDLSDCLGVSKTDSFNWGIERPDRFERGNSKPWVLVGDYTTPHVCGDGGTYEIKFPLPVSLTGPTYHTDTLSSLLQSKETKKNYIFPGQALLTPVGDFLVALGFRPPIRIFGIKPDGIETEPVLSLPTNLESNGESNVVMVQWALGKHVRKWESELESLQKTRLPDPIVAIGDPQQ